MNIKTHKPETRKAIRKAPTSDAKEGPRTRKVIESAPYKPSGSFVALGNGAYWKRPVRYYT